MGWSKRQITTQKLEIENKIASVTGLVTTTALNTKATDIGKEIPSTTGFIINPEFNRLTKNVLMQEWKKQRKALQVKVK